MTIRFRLAGWLCRVAALLRREQWYVADVFHGVPGNRIAELRERIWLNCVMLDTMHGDSLELRAIDRDLAELAQLAGEAWGHVWPKKTNQSVIDETLSS